MKRTLRPPAGFRFEATVWSHGWFDLPPFSADPAARRLTTAVEIDGAAVPLELAPVPGGRIEIRSPVRLARAAGDRAVRSARAILNLDADLTEFHRAMEADPATRWIARGGYGRLLRGASVWEDLVKLVLTTNCTWAFTRKMTERLVALCGADGPDGLRAFPGPERVAALGERALREEVRAGYRAPALARLACRVAGGDLDPERWGAAADRDAAALRKELLALPGVGPYVADNLLRLAGRPAGLGLDSWLRAKQAEVYHGGRAIADRTIERRYRRHGRWAGLALWCDMTRDWFDARGRPARALASTATSAEGGE